MEKSYFEVIKERFSCREFTDEVVSRDALNKILEAGSLAPTAVNFQPQRIYVVENPALLEKLAEASRFTFNAKTILVVTFDTNVSWHRKRDNKDHGEIDASIAATHMMLACTALGLGSCYVCSLKDEMIKEILDIPTSEVVSCMLPIGYPKEIKEHNTRKPLEDIVIYK